jgi:putative hydrolase of the HAD superfamily
VIRAVTFDYWRTLLWEAPGDLVRFRISHWRGLLGPAGREVPDDEELAAAHQIAFEEAAASWLANRQYRAEHAAARMIRELGISVAPTTEQRLVAAFSTAGEETPLKTVPNLRPTLEALRERGIRIGIVCDVGLTPSAILRGHLAQRGLLPYFDHWSFSDDVGAYKPDPEIFAHALTGLGVSPHETAHVGDTRRTDVAGARAAGLLPVRYSGVFDDTDESVPDADVVISDHAALLPRIGAAAGWPGTR